ncbi:MAG TPA: hypothetical protein VLE89_03880 [Chlamydiales bacterium]|nr:hypothetical protein [Chlamydiales bacterium]
MLEGTFYFLSLLSSLCTPIAERHPTIFYYNGQYYYDNTESWYGPGWYYGHWYGSKEAYWIWRRRYPYWWNRVQQRHS